MALVIQAFNQTVYNIGTGAIDVDAEPYRVMLLTGYIFNAVHENLSQVQSYQIADGGGYVGGGLLLTGTVWAAGAGQTRLEADNLVFTATGVVPDFDSFVVFAANSNKLLLHGNFGEIVQLVNSDELILPITNMIEFNWGT